MQKTDLLEAVQDQSLRGGTRLRDEGIEFALFSHHATQVELCLFDDAGEEEVARYKLFEHEDHIWRGFLPNEGAGLKYGYRVHGPFDPGKGHWFNPAKLLVDPIARQIFGNVINHPALFAYQQTEERGAFHADETDSAPYVPKCVVTPDQDPAQTSPALANPASDMIIYELHVSGFSRLHPDVPENLRGTFAGLVSDPVLSHLKELGVTAVELLPVMPFNDEPHLWSQGLSNYWGYNSFNFFASDPRYGEPDAFRAMVKKFHEAGIEVILDVVYNHTGEGDRFGPTLSLRGIDNASYYKHMPDDPGTYVNDTGCGNTLDFEHPYVREMVLSSLRVWALEMGVDGFRFDLAPVLGRSANGFSSQARFFEELHADPVLSRLKLIAEPWDIGPGGYQLGQFPRGWSEWNDQYRDTVRAFWRGDDSIMGKLAAKLSGSKELFQTMGRRPQAGINFISAHDGFTLQDLVSYEHKHNDANGEQNKDGHSHNLSRNHGAEGESDDPAIKALRQRQKRNMLATLFLSQGIPMLQAGDELGRSQKGNNNSYCQNNEISWLDWQNADLELFAFVAKLIKLRQTYPSLRLHGFLTGGSECKGEQSDITWLSPDGTPLQDHDWDTPYARCFGFHLTGVESAEGNAEENTGESDDANAEQPLLVLMNAHFEAVEFNMPTASYGKNWQIILDTSEDVEGEPIGDRLAVPPHSLIIFAGNKEKTGERSAQASYGLSDLCAMAGIEESYHDLAGHEHHLSDEGKIHLLEVLGHDASSPEQIDQRVRSNLKEQWNRLVPPVIILRQSQEGQSLRGAKVRLPENHMGEKLNWSITLEAGQVLKGELHTDHLALNKSARIGRQLFHELMLDPPEQLPFGYHDLSITVGELQASARFIIAPLHCYHPSWMETEEHLWGIAHQVYSLGGHGTKPIGDFSDLGTLAFAAGEAGADILGMSPLHALFPHSPERVSPYSPSSRTALNPLFLDVSLIEGIEQVGDVASAPVTDRDLVDYAHVVTFKGEVFNRLYEIFLVQGSATAKGDFARFCFERGDQLRSYARYCTLSEHFGGQTHASWPQAYRDPTSKEVHIFAKDNENRIYFHCWLQWQADQQLSGAAKLARERGMKVGLYGDLAVGVASDGAECWANSSSYLHEISFGAPPDAFNAKGQNWSMPPFHPEILKATAYQPYIEILRENMRHCGALRIDHVMWLQRMFVIPIDEPASNGAYVRFPFDDLLAILALESARAKCIIIGEDLGTVPAGFRDVMERENILSYRLMRFETGPDGSYKGPDEYPYQALATPSSHDLPTLRGFVVGEDLKLLQELAILTQADEIRAALEGRNRDLLNLINALKEQGLWEGGMIETISDEGRLDELVLSISRYLARSNAAITMLNLEDLAGSSRQVNVPGTVDEVPNWRHRLAFDPARLREDDQVRKLLDFINEDCARLSRDTRKRA